MLLQVIQHNTYSRSQFLQHKMISHTLSTCQGNPICFCSILLHTSRRCVPSHVIGALNSSGRMGTARRTKRSLQRLKASWPVTGHSRGCILSITLALLLPSSRAYNIRILTTRLYMSMYASFPSNDVLGGSPSISKAKQRLCEWPTFRPVSSVLNSLHCNFDLVC